MLMIYKYNVLVEDYFEVLLSENWEFLSVQIQNELPVMWILVNPESVIRRHKFSVKGTGHTVMHNEKYFGTFQIGKFVWHLFYQGIV